MGGGQVHSLLPAYATPYTGNRYLTDCATPQGKFSKMIESKVHCALFVDILSSAKIFSLATQKTDVSKDLNAATINLKKTKKVFLKDKSSYKNYFSFCCC